MSQLLGVDGGGSKTRAAVATPDGRILGTGSAGTSNYQVVGLEAALAALETAVAEALACAGIAPTDSAFSAACFGLAGADRPADVERLSNALRGWRTIQRLTIVNDAELVLAAAAGTEGAAIALISGTGSICVGRDAAGRRARVGGWGHLLGDEGSGYDLAVRTLRLATQTADGRAAAHRLLSAALGCWQLAKPEDLIPFAYQRGTTRAEVAELAWTVLRLAEEGEAHAWRLVEETGRALARHVDAVRDRLRLERPPLALGGGLLLGSALLRRGVGEHLRTPVGEIVTVPNPYEGALRLAASLASGDAVGIETAP